MARIESWGVGDTNARVTSYLVLKALHPPAKNMLQQQRLQVYGSHVAQNRSLRAAKLTRGSYGRDSGATTHLQGLQGARLQTRLPQQGSARTQMLSVINNGLADVAGDSVCVRALHHH